jgi:hypothetical protein
MENYHKVKLRFEENGCILLTTFEEFEELREKVLKKSYQFVRVRFIGTCSHESDVVYTNFNIRNAMEQWSNGIQNNIGTTGLTNPLAYQVDLRVNQLDRNGSTVKTYTFKDAYPTEIGTIELDFDQVNAIEMFPITFQYNFWTSDTSTGGGSGFGINTTINTPIGSFPI